MVIKKNSKNNLLFSIFHLKIDFHRFKNIFFVSDFSIRIQSFHFSQKLWWKNCRKVPNFYVAENPIVFKLFKILIPNFHSTNWRLEWRLRQNFRRHLLYRVRQHNFLFPKGNKTSFMYPKSFIFVSHW